MSASQLIAFDACLRAGPDFIKRNGATYEIAIKALQELQNREKQREDAAKKEEERKEAESEARRMKLARNALRAKEIMQAKKYKDKMDELVVLQQFGNSAGRRGSGEKRGLQLFSGQRKGDQSRQRDKVDD